MIRHVDLGSMEYRRAWQLQEETAAAIVAGACGETLFLVEHPPVYTIGSGGDMENVLDPDIDVIRVNRGGDVTFHGPGQLVGYPLVNLGHRGRDLHRYLRLLEELLVAVCGHFGVNAFTVPGQTGVWTGNGKIAAIGVAVRRWVTMHGFALNVRNDLAPFVGIHPCGLRGCRVSSLLSDTGRDISLAEVKNVVVEEFRRLFDEQLPYVPGESLESLAAFAPGE
jgi:lipoyl(octanoyl) transferase